MEKESRDGKRLDPEVALADFLLKHGKYLTEENYTNPTTRYEAWMMASCLANLLVAERLKTLSGLLIEAKGGLDVFQKKAESPIMEENEKPSGDGPEAIAKIRRRR